MKRDWIGQFGFLACAGLVVLSLLLIYILIGANSYQTFTQSHISFTELFTSSQWDGRNHFGLLTFITGSFTLVLLGLALAVPLSLGVALFLTEIAPPWLANPLRSIVELFLGIPSVVFGLLGLTVLVPFFGQLLDHVAQTFTGAPDVSGHAPHFYTGTGIIPAAIVVTFMVMPTITTIAVEALRTIPRDLREGSLALGATRWQTITKTVVPAAAPGIMTGVILGASRILGETLAVAFVLGGAGAFPIRLLDTYPYVQIGNTGVLTTTLLGFKDIIAGQPLYNVVWTASFILLLISGLMIAASRTIAARRIYQ